MRNISARIGAALALSVILAAPSALAQKKTSKEKGGPGPGSAPSGERGSSSSTAAPDVAVTAPAPVVETPAPVVTAEVTAPEPKPASAEAGAPESDVTEVDGHRYYFVGLRYRGQVIPQAFLGLFVQGGATVFTNSVGLEFDMRKDGFSLIPNVTYTEYATGNMLFLQKNTDPTAVGNWSMVNSSLKVMYLGADLLWSAKIAKNFDFEYGLGFGFGIVFGSLVDNWVRAANSPNESFTLNGQPGKANTDGNGAVAGNPNHYYVPCTAVGAPGTGCNALDHSNSTVNKVNNHTDGFGFGGGLIPPIFFNVTIPQVGVRIKPIKSFEGRVGMGFNIPNGFMFTFSGDYGLEKLVDKK